MLQTDLHLHVVLTRRTNGRNLQTFNKTMFSHPPPEVTEHKTGKYFQLCCLERAGPSALVFSYML